MPQKQQRAAKRGGRKKSIALIPDLILKKVEKLPPERRALFDKIMTGRRPAGLSPEEWGETLDEALEIAKTADLAAEREEDYWTLTKPTISYQSTAQMAINQAPEKD